MFEAGGWVLLESAIADLPADLRWLFESGAVTLEQLTAIYRSRGATSVADLAAAVADGALGGIDGVGPEVETAVAAALPMLRVSIPRIPLGRATSIVEPFLAALRASAGINWALSRRIAPPGTGHRRRHRDRGVVRRSGANRRAAAVASATKGDSSIGASAAPTSCRTACRWGSACRLPRTPAPSSST